MVSSVSFFLACDDESGNAEDAVDNATIYLFFEKCSYYAI